LEQDYAAQQYSDVSILSICIGFLRKKIHHLDNTKTFKAIHTQSFTAEKPMDFLFQNLVFPGVTLAVNKTYQGVNVNHEWELITFNL